MITSSSQRYDWGEKKKVKPPKKWLIFWFPEGINIQERLHSSSKRCIYMRVCVYIKLGLSVLITITFNSLAKRPSEHLSLRAPRRSPAPAGPSSTPEQGAPRQSQFYLFFAHFRGGRPSPCLLRRGRAPGDGGGRAGTGTGTGPGAGPRCRWRARHRPA